MQLVEHEPVFHPAGDDAGGEQQHAGERSEQQGGAEQADALQRLQRLGVVDHGTAGGEFEHRADQQHHRNHQADVARDGRHLRAKQVGDLVNEPFDRARFLDVLELGHHGRCGHGRLFGGHREVQQHDQHERHGVVEARGKAAPESREAQAVERELRPGGEADHRAAARRLAQHVLVLRGVAGDVVLAALGVALGHLGGGEVRAGGNERPDAAVVEPDLGQVGQQRHRGAFGLVGLQAVQQLLHPHHALAQLAQAEHDAHRHTVLFEVRIHRVGGVAARVELVAQPRGRLQRLGALGAVHTHRAAQRFQVAGQLVERLLLLRFGRHAHADLGGKAGRADLAHAGNHGVHQCHLPEVGLVVAGLRVAAAHQIAKAQQGRAVQRLEPANVKAPGQHEVEQLAQIVGLGRVGQGLLAQAVAKLAQKGRAWGKTVVGQQGCEVHRGHEALPPATPTLPELGVGLHAVEKLTHARHAGLHVLFVAAHPAHGVDQPQVALRQRRVGIDGVDERDDGHGRGTALQCSTRDGASPAPLARKSNAGTTASKRSPSSATQKKLPRMLPVGVFRRVPLVYWNDSPGRSSGW